MELVPPPRIFSVENRPYLSESSLVDREGRGGGEKGGNDSDLHGDSIRVDRWM